MIVISVDAIDCVQALAKGPDTGDVSAEDRFNGILDDLTHWQVM